MWPYPYVADSNLTIASSPWKSLSVIQAKPEIVFDPWCSQDSCVFPYNLLNMYKVKRSGLEQTGSQNNQKLMAVFAFEF